MSAPIILKGSSKLLKPVITEIMAIYQLLADKDMGTIYAHVNDLNSVRRKGKPKVLLYFIEDTDFNKLAPPNNIYEGRRRLDGVISFRLMDETTQTISKANATMIATQIKNVFGSNGGFVWNKGKTMYTYTEWEKGYQFQLLCKTPTEAKRIIRSTLSLQNHAPIWKYFNTVENDEELIKYPEVPGTQVIMGEVIPIPKERPLVDVRFQYGYIKLDGVNEPINLYDRRSKLPRTLVK
jgi:hypothetical protein